MPKVVTFSVFLPSEISSSAVWAWPNAHQEHSNAASIFFICPLLVVSSHAGRKHAGRRRLAHSGISANVHTAPPVGMTFAAKRLGLLPPRPERMVTYCLPLCV